MIAILGGFGAACAWAISTLCSSRSSRLLDPLSVLAWVMLTGLLITTPIALAVGVPSHVSGSAWGWLLLSGAGNVVGLATIYAALRIGQVALVAPIVSCEGAIAATIALLLGESIAPSAGAALVAIAAGVGVSAIPARDSQEDVRAAHVKAVGMAIAAALLFGASLYATARAGSELPSAWVVLAARVIGVAALPLPLLLNGRLRLTRAAVPLVVTSGVCEVLGFFAYTWGARHGIAIAAVLSSQFAPLAAIGGYGLFSERLSRVQLTGIATVIAGVAVLGLLRA